MKKIYAQVILITFLLPFASKAQRPIPQTLFGQNAWFIQNSAANPAANLTGYYPYMDTSGVTFCRIGGIDANWLPLYTWQPNFSVQASDVDKLKKMIDSLRKYNIEPIIEVGYAPPHLNCAFSPLNGVTLQNQAKIAANVVFMINKTLYTANPIKYWIIANEPDLRDTCTSTLLGGFRYKFDSQSDADSIAKYVREFSWQMKDKDTSIKIIAPEMAAFGTDVGYDVNKIMNKLISTNVNNGVMGQITTGNGSGKFYVDQITIHNYPTINSRQAAIDNPLDTVNGFKGMLESNSPSSFPPRKGVTKMINANTTRTPSNLSIGLTEYNISNASGGNEGTNLAGVIKGYDYRSFLGGQWLAQMMSVGMNNPFVTHMNMWSVDEAGISGDPCQTGWGFISNCGGNKRLRSTYHHFSLVANYFHGKYYSGQSNKPNVKTFSSVETNAGFYIMVLNMDTVDLKYDIGFNGASGGSSPLQLTYNLASEEYLGTNQNYLNDTITKKTTFLLLFDCNGVLIWKKKYSEQDNLNDIAPHFKQIGNTNVDPQIANCGNAGIGGHINSNTTYSNTTVYVTSDLLITGNNTLTFDNATVVFSPGVKINANPNAGVEIKNGTVMFGCNGSQWSGIIMNGNHQLNDHLIIDNSILVNAPIVVSADKIGSVSIKGSIFANGATAISLNHSKLFTISGNLIAGYNTAIQTKNTNPNYPSVISENRIISVDKGMDFNGDSHDLITIACNVIGYKSKGIFSRNTTLAAQGNATTGAGNVFIKTGAGTPSDYIDHTGNATSYYYDPGQVGSFLFPNVMNIPKIQAISDRACLTAQTQCSPLAGILEQKPSKNSFIIYPNPSSGMFTINYGTLKGNWNIMVHDVLGRLISSKKIDVGLQSTTIEIFAKGIYMVSLQNGVERITQKVLVE